MAIAESCDTYFYDLGRRMTIDRMHDLLAPYGLGPAPGSIPPTSAPACCPQRQWKRDALNQPWYPGETISPPVLARATC